MQRVLIIFRIAFGFFKRYFLQYLIAWIIPFLLLVVGFFVIGVCGVLANPKIISLITYNFPNPSVMTYLIIISIILALIAIVAFSYAFWKICLIYYAINPAIYDYAAKKEYKPFSFYLKEIRKDAKGLIIFLLKSSLVILIPITLFFIYAMLNGFLMLRMQLINSVVINGVFILAIVSIVLLIPYFNLAAPAYYYRKNEKVESIFLDCYRYIDINFITIILINLFVWILFNKVLQLTIFSWIIHFIITFAIIFLIFTWYYTKRFKE